MEYLIIVLVGCSIILFAYYESNKKTKIEPLKRKNCVHCGAQIDKSAGICPSCGKNPDPFFGKIFCVNCGAEIGMSETICPVCGMSPISLQKKCIHCETVLSKYVTVCLNCGKDPNKLDGDDIPKKYCLYCGAEIPKTATVCPICRRNQTFPPSKSRETLDELFAKENNMWVCEWCETLNPNSISVCAACGKRKIVESR